MDILILNEKDAEAYRQLRLKGLQTDPLAFGASYEDEITLNLEDFKKQLIPKKSSFVVGAFVENKLICTIKFKRFTGLKMRHKAILTAMYCDSEYRKRSIAKKVLQFTLEKAKQMEGLIMLQLMVGSKNTKAKKLYETFGFQSYGVEPSAIYYNDQFYDEDLMYLYL